MSHVFSCLLLSQAHYSASTSQLRGFVKSVYQFDSRSCAERQTAGYICNGCDSLGLCINRNGVWEFIPLDKCNTAEGFACDAVLGVCSNSTGSCKPDLGRFPCTSAGVFPDPYDCQAYHVCFMSGPSLIAMDIECPAKTAFNPQSGDCSLEVTPEFCNVYPFTCERPGDMGPWRMNANIFYICVATDPPLERVVFPQLYRCPPLQIFDGAQCVADGGSTSTTTATTTSGGGEEFQCPGPGLYPDGNSCRHYYYCDANLQGQRVQCPEGTRFDRNASACVFGNC